MSAILRLVSRTDLDNHAGIAALAGWKPRHRSMEAELAERSDLAERDAVTRFASEQQAIR